MSAISKPPFLDRDTPEFSRFFAPASFEDWAEAAEPSTGSRDPRTWSTDLGEGLSQALYTDPSQPVVRASGLADGRGESEVCAIVARSSSESLAEALHADVRAGASWFWLQAQEALGRAPQQPEAFEAQVLSVLDPARHGVFVQPRSDWEAWTRQLRTWQADAGISASGHRGGVLVDRIDPAVEIGWNDLASHIQSVCETQLYALGVGADGLAAQGAGVVLESAAALAAWVEALEALRACGVADAQIVRRSVVRFSVGSDVVLHTARLRAARRLFCAVSAALDLDTDVQAPAFHAVGAVAEFTRVEPWMNVLRGSGAALSALLAHVEFLSLPPRDIWTAEPSREARRLAITTPWVLKAESQLSEYTDAAAGARVIEALTEQICVQTWGLFQEILHAGGWRAWRASGALERALAKARGMQEHALSNLVQTRVGLNQFARLEAEFPEASLRMAWHASGVWEGLRDRANTWQQTHGRALRAQIVRCGDRRASASGEGFARTVLTAAGWRVESVNADQIADLSRDAIELFVFCGPAADVVSVVSGLPETPRVHLAWVGSETSEPQKLGVDSLLFKGMDVVVWLDARLAAWGV